ncbi:DUF551 domain-containing protein [Enterobacter hormaechei]
MSTLTKEWLLKTIAELEEERDATPGAVNEDAANALAAMKIALASLEAEAMTQVLSSRAGNDTSTIDKALPEGTMLYTAPPAPVFVPDELTREEYKRRFMEDDDFDDTFRGGWKAHRAAMLQGADRPQNEPQNIPENIPATQFNPVADLYGLTSPTGSETSFTFDAVEARDFIDGGWSCQEYVELGRFQETMIQGAEPVSNRDEFPLDYLQGLKDGLEWAAQLAEANHPHTGDWLYDDPLELAKAIRKGPDMPTESVQGWIPCSERMPSAGEKVLAYRPDAPESNDPLIKMATYVGGSAHGHGFDCYCKPTHWMPLPAAPQQEDNNG